MNSPNKRPRKLVLVLGDQLDPNSAAFDDFDPRTDAVWMAEVEHEASHVWCHKQRIALFFSAMRHFRDELRQKNITVHYHQLSERRAEDRGRDFASVLKQDVRKLRPDELAVVLPGDERVRASLLAEADRLKTPLKVLPDRHFFCDPDEFRQFARGRKTLLLETFYREMRRKHDILMDGKDPIGGQWNFDHDNRASFGKEGPGRIPAPSAFRPDQQTQQVLDLVESRFADHPGELGEFNLPVTRQQAKKMLRNFVTRSLPLFGKYEDAMWTDEPFVYHSRLSTSLNLKLLDPRACVERAIAAYHKGDAPLNSVEGFVRQIVGWREFIRGIYWLYMPEYIDKNELGHDLDVPPFFWDGDTDMQCVRQSMQHVLRYGYAHHIPRLMVLGNLALILGVHPRKFHDWHMAMYLDAVDWVSLPNTLGMSQYGDGGIVGTKPYAATGNYIHKMSDFCGNCAYNYKQSTGEAACPITTLYWDFLDRHYERFRKNARMSLQMKHVTGKRNTKEIEGIRRQATALRKTWYKR
jgi:deoxyribodipyrimidine photolyase-related protein